MTIIDLSWRLPGPFATYLLAQQGMKVIKYEDAAHRDPFLSWDWDPAFAEIYSQMQAPKELRIIDFGNPSDAGKLHEQITASHAVVMNLPPSVEAKLGLSQLDVDKNFANVSFTRLGFREDASHNAHDLNTLAHSRLLRMHILDRTDPIIAPPMLPVTGLAYGHHIAIHVLANILKQQSQTSPIQSWCYLQDAVANVCSAYYADAQQSRNPATFLHNGRFPCYNLYRTMDGGYVAVAAVEAKFWKRFRELTELTSLSDNDGLSHDKRADEVKQMIVDAISSRSAEYWHKTFDGENCCVDVVGPYKSEERAERREERAEL